MSKPSRPAGQANPPMYTSRMVQREAPANLDELRPLGEADPGQKVELLGEALEASERVSKVKEKEDSKKLSEMFESQESLGR